MAVNGQSLWQFSIKDLFGPFLVNLIISIQYLPLFTLASKGIIKRPTHLSSSANDLKYCWSPFVAFDAIHSVIKKG